jgi:hypothetical protein
MRDLMMLDLRLGIANEAALSTPSKFNHQFESLSCWGVVNLKPAAGHQFFVPKKCCLKTSVYTIQPEVQRLSWGFVEVEAEAEAGQTQFERAEEA